MERVQKEGREWKGRTGTGENGNRGEWKKGEDGNRGECLEGRSERIRKVGTERKFDNRIKKRMRENMGWWEV
jgi:hypothetical protein